MFTSRAILAIAIVLSVQNSILAEKETKKADTPPPKKEQKVERRSVSARVESAVGKGVGIRAEKVPGEFAIPEGMTARNFKYKFHDPKSKIKLDKLTESSIYSITEKRYVSEAASGSDFELPPGKYKFVVGGRPGAYGSLSFDVAPGDSVSVVIKDNVPEADLPQNGTLNVIIWVPEYPSLKFHWTFEVRNGIVTGNGVHPNPVTSPDILNEQGEYRFQGRIVNKRIKGTVSQKRTWGVRNRDGSVTDVVYKGGGPFELRLRIDSTVVGSEVHSGTRNDQPQLQERKMQWNGTWKLETK